MKNLLKSLSLILVLTLALGFSGLAVEDTKAEDKVVCPVSGKEVADTEKAPSLEYNGKTYFFCCAGCLDKFKAEPEKYLAQSGKNTICPVMGNEIKDFEKAPSVEYKGKTYYFCCAGCIESFNADPEKYIAELDKKVTCSVSGEEIRMGNAAGSMKHGGQTYYFCCADCKEKFTKDPEKYTSGKKAPEACGSCTACPIKK
ncbi:MAG: YHS domain-containing protein [Acidobacteria bacterium]|nr:YHS domain-containing protein [Acidobacteriota bacterium]MCG2814993.1 YHS domain-containing protein [Candidatus Aminicenantes bacterium]